MNILCMYVCMSVIFKTILVRNYKTIKIFQLFFKLLVLSSIRSFKSSKLTKVIIDIEQIGIFAIRKSSNEINSKGNFFNCFKNICKF